MTRKTFEVPAESKTVKVPADIETIKVAPEPFIVDSQGGLPAGTYRVTSEGNTRRTSGANRRVVNV